MAKFARCALSVSQPLLCVHWFTRETNDVRALLSLAAGQPVQYLTTTLTVLILAFV